MGARPLVLVTEDDAVNRRVCVEMLKRLGYDAVGVADGSQALAAFAPERFAAVLMDCMMPELDGYAATAELRRRHPEHRVPVIAVTANSMAGDRERRLDAGMDGYLAKPIRLGNLAAALAHSVVALVPAPSASAALEGVVAVLDVELLRELGLLEPAEGEPPVAAVFAAVFAAMAGAWLADLHTAIAEGSADGQRAAAHTLKGTAANLSASAVSSLAADIEQRAKAGARASSTRCVASTRHKPAATPSSCRGASRARRRGAARAARWRRACAARRRAPQARRARRRTARGARPRAPARRARG